MVNRSHHTLSEDRWIQPGAVLPRQRLNSQIEAEPRAAVPVPARSDFGACSGGTSILQLRVGAASPKSDECEAPGETAVDQDLMPRPEASPVCLSRPHGLAVQPHPAPPRRTCPAHRRPVRVGFTGDARISTRSERRPRPRHHRRAGQRGRDDRRRQGLPAHPGQRVHAIQAAPLPADGVTTIVQAILVLHHVEAPWARSGLNP